MGGNVQRRSSEDENRWISLSRVSPSVYIVYKRYTDSFFLNKTDDHPAPHTGTGAHCLVSLIMVEHPL
jgi:hypothetical protein